MVGADRQVQESKEGGSAAPPYNNFFQETSLAHSSIVADERRHRHIDRLLVDIIRGSRKDLDKLDIVIAEHQLDAIAFNNKSYQHGSVSAVERVMTASSKGTQLSLAIFEASQLSYTNSLGQSDDSEGGHSAGNRLVRECNHSIMERIKTLDSSALVFRGPNGAVIVLSSTIGPQHLASAELLSDLEQTINQKIPSELAERGVHGKLRVGATLLETRSCGQRSAAQECYYTGLRQAGAAAEYSKKTGVPEIFSEITKNLRLDEVDQFLLSHHNYIPPEAAEGTLFTVRDQVRKLSILMTIASERDEKWEAELKSLDTSGAIKGILENRERQIYPQLEAALIANTTCPLLSAVRSEAMKLIAMTKRPSRFESNVQAVHEGREIPIFNIATSRRLQERLLREGIPFFRADGDLDHLRDMFRQYKVTGADSAYAAFYHEMARCLRRFEADCKHVRIYMEKQSSSDEFGIIIVNAQQTEARAILETARLAVAEAGSKSTFTRVNKATGEVLAENAGVTATIACSYKQPQDNDSLHQCMIENDGIITLRKFIPGKNTSGSYDDISKMDAKKIALTIESYIAAAVKDGKRRGLLTEVKSVLRANNLLLHQLGVDVEELRQKLEHCAR